MKSKQKRFGHAKILCLVLSLLMMVSMMPMGATFASATDGEETSSEVTLTEESVEPSESTEPEESEPGEEPEESPDPENTTYDNSISGMLWLDMFDDIENSIYAGDGIRQAEESPLAGYRVELYKADDTDNAIATTTTSANGRYSFENIEPGSYVVGVKTTTMDGVEYLLPLFWLDGTTGDNRFVATYDEAADAYLYAYTKSIEVQADSEITGMDAGMRTVPEAQPMADYTIDMSTVSTGGTGYTYSGGVITFTAAADNHTYTITGTTTTKRIVVPTGRTLNIILDGASITRTITSSVDFYAAFQLVGTAKVTLTLADGSDNLMSIASSNALNEGIAVPSAATLTINGTTGKLTAIGKNGGAGIGGGGSTVGGGTGLNSGTITINGGIITATGGSTGAGIGGLEATDCGTITINGGSVTATGGINNAPGIGVGTGAGGFGPSNITINGGTVTAKSGSTTSPGIGSYSKTVNIGTVIFTGGSIYPTDAAGTVSVYPNPTNGSTYGAPDPVGMLTFPGYSDGDAFSIMAGGTVSSYLYKANAHPNGNVYAWLAYPGVSTDPATNVTANSATMNGTYYMNGTTISSAYFEYGTSTGYGSTKTLTTPTNTISGNIESVSDNLTGLSSNTTYHYRLVITTGSVTVPGNDMTFTTKPVVDTLTASPTGSSTATASGTIASGSENISDVIITYATDAGFTANVVTLDGSSGVAFTNTTYTANITGLTSGQTYYVKVEAVGLGGTSDAKTGSFLAGGNPVTEKFVDLSGSAVDSTGLPDNTVIVTGSYTASGIPTSHTVSGDTYTYIGYKLDSYTAGDTLTSGTPSSVTITGSRTVYYVYNNIVNLTISNEVAGVYANMDKAFTYTVYFEDSAGAPLASGTQFTYTGGIITGSGATAPSGGTLTLDSAGKTTVPLTLTTGQTITIEGVATSVKVRVVQTTDANYTTSFKDSEDASSTSGADTGVRSMTAADRTFDYTNTRSVVPGGISTGSGSIVLLSLMALALASGLAITAAYLRRRAGAR